MPLDTFRLPSRTFANEVPPECGAIQVLHDSVNHSKKRNICAEVNVLRHSGPLRKLHIQSAKVFMPPPPSVQLREPARPR